MSKRSFMGNPSRDDLIDSCTLHKHASACAPAPMKRVCDGFDQLDRPEHKRHLEAKKNKLIYTEIGHW